MKRGQIYSVAGGSGYAGKPRPVVIIQDDHFDATESVTICAFTTDLTLAPLLRIAVEPSPVNGLKAPSMIMVDKVTTIRRTKLGAHIGELESVHVRSLEQALVVFLGIAG